MNSVDHQNSADAPGSSAAAIELVCPAGSLPALKAAVDHGANCVHLGLRDATNARNAAGLLLATRETEGFLVLNGTQTQSARASTC